MLRVFSPISSPMVIIAIMAIISVVVCTATGITMPQATAIVTPGSATVTPTILSTFGTPSTGPTGPRGSIGKVGFATLGSTGPTGITGLPGFQFLISSTGSTGSRGVSGPTGLAGATGPTGAAGASSILGTTGPVGQTGDNGPTQLFSFGPTGGMIVRDGNNQDIGTAGSAYSQVVGPVGSATTTFWFNGACVITPGLVAVGDISVDIPYTVDISLRFPVSVQLAFHPPTISGWQIFAEVDGPTSMGIYKYNPVVSLQVQALDGSDLMVGGVTVANTLYLTGCRR